MQQGSEQRSRTCGKQRIYCGLSVQIPSGEGRRPFKAHVSVSAYSKPCHACYLEVMPIMSDMKLMARLAFPLLVLVPTVVLAHHTRQERQECQGLLRQIDSAKEQEAMDGWKVRGYQATWRELLLYLPSEFRHAHCPSGGVWTIGPVGQEPYCSFHDPETARCGEELRKLDSIKEQFYMDGRLLPSARCHWQDIRAFTATLPRCPEGGVLSIGTVEEPVSCSLHGEFLPPWHRNLSGTYEAVAPLQISRGL